MTLMLASVADAREARMAMAARVDIVDLKDPAAGALGALPASLVRSLVREIDGACPVSATAGDLPMHPARVLDAVRTLGETGIDFVKLGIFPAARAPECICALAPLCDEGLRLVVVLFADLGPDPAWLALAAEAGCYGVMLDTAGKGTGGLRRHLSGARLAAFVAQARALGLAVGLAGSLGPEDLPHLLPLSPDYLGFRAALCRGGVRTARLSPQALRRVRGLIPRHESRPALVSAAPAALGAARERA